MSEAKFKARKLYLEVVLYLLLMKRFLRKTSEMAKNCQNPSGPNFSTNGPILTQKTNKTEAKSKNFPLLQFFMKPLCFEKIAPK